MRLHVKHYKTDRRIDICDDYDNVIRRMGYNDPTIDLGTSIRINAYLSGYVEGWTAAKNSIGNCESTGNMVDVDAQNQRMLDLQGSIRIIGEGE